MQERLEEKIRRMHKSLSRTRSDDFSKMAIEEGNDGIFDYKKLIFDRSSDNDALMDAAMTLVANIASLKDVVKKWISKNNISINVEGAIDNNMSMAIVHDLWNDDKHGGLDRKSRSGKIPKLKDLCTALSLGGSTQPNASVVFTMDYLSNSMAITTQGGMEAQLLLCAT